MTSTPPSATKGFYFSALICLHLPNAEFLFHLFRRRSSAKVCRRSPSGPPVNRTFVGKRFQNPARLGLAHAKHTFQIATRHLLALLEKSESSFFVVRQRHFLSHHRQLNANSVLGNREFRLCSRPLIGGPYPRYPRSKSLNIVQPKEDVRNYRIPQNGDPGLWRVFPRRKGAGPPR